MKNLKVFSLVFLVFVVSTSCSIFAGEESSEAEGELVLCNQLQMGLEFWRPTLNLGNGAAIEEATFFLAENSCVSTISDGDIRYTFQVEINKSADAVTQFTRELGFQSNATKLASFDNKVLKESKSVWIWVRDKEVIILRAAKLRGITQLDEDQYEIWLKKAYDRVKSRR